jgi:hypothetical protein
MFVKGTAYIARKNLLMRELGEDQWNTFLQAYLKENPSFPRSILTVTNIDVLEFIKLNDAVIDRFYRGDKKTYFRFGEMSAEWALREGPYKKMRIAKDYRGFVEGQASVFRMYYSEGNAKSIMSEGVVEYWSRVPKPYRHVYLEYTPIGYLRRGLELTGCRVMHTECVKGFSKGDDEIHYRLPLKT